MPLALAAALGALVATGCSIVTTTGAPAVVSPATPPDCTTSKLAVYGDGVLSGGAIGTSLFLGLAALANTGDKRSDLGYATLFTFLASVPFAVSGVIGGVRVQSCRRAHEQWRALQAPAYVYPPPPPFPAQ